MRFTLPVAIDIRFALTFYTSTKFFHFFPYFRPPFPDFGHFFAVKGSTLPPWSQWLRHWLYVTSYRWPHYVHSQSGLKLSLSWNGCKMIPEVLLNTISLQRINKITQIWSRFNQIWYGFREVAFPCCKNDLHYRICRSLKHANSNHTGLMWD